jgi:hypothetical protein
MKPVLDAYQKKVCYASQQIDEACRDRRLNEQIRIHCNVQGMIASLTVRIF